VTVPLCGAFAAAFFWVPTKYVFLTYALQQLFGSLFVAAAVSIAQSLVPVAIRATAAACFFFVIYFVATGIGPQAIGIASDLLRPTFGEDSLRISLFAATSLVIPSSYFYYRASTTYRRDLETADVLNKRPDARSRHDESSISVIQ
jgi:hypothetical protein